MSDNCFLRYATVAGGFVGLLIGVGLTVELSLNVISQVLGSKGSVIEIIGISLGKRIFSYIIWFYPIKMSK